MKSWLNGKLPEVRLVSKVPRLRGGGWGVVGVFPDEGHPPAELPPEVAFALEPVLRQVTGTGQEGVRRETVSPEGGSWTVFALGERRAWSLEAAEKFLSARVTEALDRKVSELFVSFPLQEAWLERAILSRLLRSAALAAYRFEAFRSKVSKSPLFRIDVAVPRVGRTVVREAMEWADAVVHGVVVARDLANQPPNEATPEALAETAAAWVRKWGGRAWVWSHRELKRRGFGALLAVGAGSQNPPCLLRAEWGEGTGPVGLVGKGVTFDSGGISLKPAERMDEMKWDKAGACTVLGVLAALAVRPLPVRVRLYLPFAENLPGGGSFRPGDILRCYNGLTVEITNTDAEGRLLLADALALAAEEGCNPIVDFATLTGACVVALGTSGAGLFANRETLAQALLEAGRRTGERLWQLPLWPEFREQMKGLHADLRNSGDRWGGACTAAAFLESFVPEPVAWAHLDIAGPAYRGRGESGIRGATGFGVATAYEWLDTHSAGVS